MALHYQKSKSKIGFGKDKEMKFVGRRRLADLLSLNRLAKEVAHHRTDSRTVRDHPALYGQCH